MKKYQKLETTFTSKQPVNNQNTSHKTSQFTNINNESLNKSLSDENAKRKNYSTATKSNNSADNDFLKTLTIKWNRSIVCQHTPV